MKRAHDLSLTQVNPYLASCIEYINVKIKNNEMKIKLNITLGTLFGLMALTSCLNSNLPDYPEFDLNEVTKVYFEYRWPGTNTEFGSPVVSTQALIASQTIKNDSVFLSLQVPAANSAFRDTVKAKVTVSNIWCYADISTASTIKPMGDAPTLGFAGDFSVPRQYKVTAANGDTRIWTIVVTNFINN